MKLEWGRKIGCPACALPFYDLRRSSVSCPHCGNSFEISDLHSKKGAVGAMDEVEIDEKMVEIAGFDFPDEPDSGIDLTDDPGIITVGEDIEDVKIVD
ncbi:MAG: FYDLN acid domain-containing protein [Holosporales bacterium]|jgi:hypothetical protein|nr:FYDLN acid domain-containing protein [Holosporales bacterium]